MTRREREQLAALVDDLRKVGWGIQAQNGWTLDELLAQGRHEENPPTRQEIAMFVDARHRDAMGKLSKILGGLMEASGVPDGLLEDVA